MFVEKIEHLKFEDKEYPLYLSVKAICEIQKKYGFIGTWTDQLMGIVKDNKNEKKHVDECDYEVVCDSLQLMINEGIRIENKLNSEKREYIDWDMAGEILTGVGITKIKTKLFQTISLGLRTEDKNEKKAITTQR